MENPIQVCTIDGISFPLIGDGFIDMSLPHVGCSICKYAVCAKCVDLFSLNHKCKYKYFHKVLRQEDYICSNCAHFFEIKEEQKIQRRRKNIADGAIIYMLFVLNVKNICVMIVKHIK